MSKIINAEYILDKKNNVELKVYLKISQPKKEVIEFVLILFLVSDSKKQEVIKYDFSKKEKLNVHKYYLKEIKKEYLDFDVDSELVFKLKNDIINNYKKYIILYKQKEYI